LRRLSHSPSCDPFNSNIFTRKHFLHYLEMVTTHYLCWNFRPISNNSLVVYVNNPPKSFHNFQVGAGFRFLVDPWTLSKIPAHSAGETQNTWTVIILE
jgi:hypothetical protein